MPVGQFVRAVYDFVKPEFGEIQLCVGDVIEIVGELDTNWLIGCNHSRSGQTGNFPKDFVETLVLPSVDKDQKLFLALRTFHGEMAEDLSFCKGDLITGIEEVDGSWWKGQINDRVGIFPLTFVKILILTPTNDVTKTSKLQNQEPVVMETVAAEDHDISETTASPVVDKMVIAKARATLDLVAQLSDELSFNRGDEIEVFELVDDVYALGRHNGMVGQFPLAFVDVFDGSVETSVNAEKQERLSKFDWWKDAKVKIVEGSLISTPSFEDQTAPISAEEEYSLNTSHAYYSSDRRDAEEEEREVEREAVPAGKTGTPPVGEEESKRSDAVLVPRYNRRFARTLFAFCAENDNELSFDMDEVVTVLSDVDGQWMEGKIGGRCGIFPSSYVELIEFGDDEHTEHLRVASSAKDCSVSTPSIDDSSINVPSIDDSSINVPSIDDSSIDDSSVNNPSINALSIDDSSINSPSIDDSFINSPSINVPSIDDSFINSPSINTPSTDDSSINVPSLNASSINAPSLNAPSSINVPSINDIATNVRSPLDSMDRICSDVTPPSSDLNDIRTDHNSNHSSVTLKTEAVAAILNSELASNEDQLSELQTETSVLIENGAISPLKSGRKSSPDEASGGEGLLELDDSCRKIYSDVNKPSEKMINDVNVVETEKEEVNCDIKSHPEMSRKLNESNANVAEDFNMAEDLASHQELKHLPEKPTVMQKPKLKPKPNWTLMNSKSFDVTDPVAKKKPPMKKGVTFCLEDVVIQEKDDVESGEKCENFVTAANSSRDDVVDPLVKKKPAMKKGVTFCIEDDVIVTKDDVESAETCDNFVAAANSPSYNDSPENFTKNSSSVGESRVHEKRSMTAHKDGNKGSALVKSDSLKLEEKILSDDDLTSPVVSCHFSNSGELSSISFKKDIQRSSHPVKERNHEIISPKTSSNSSFKKKSTKKEKESKDGLKIGQSLFYSDVGTIDATAPSEHSRKIPPRPARPRQGLGQGQDNISPSNSVDGSIRPIPCRPAPPRPTVVPIKCDLSDNVEGLDCLNSENEDVIRDLERRIKEIKMDLANCRKCESDLTDGSLSNDDDDELEFYRANIRGLTDELQQLEENLSRLRPKNQTRRHSKLSSDGKTIPERPKAAKRRQEENQKKRKETRIKVVEEIIQSENDYLQSLCLCLETCFNSDLTETKCPSIVDMEALFGNMYDVVEHSQKFLTTLETNVVCKPFEEQLIGRCFEELHGELKSAYAIYCRNHDNVITLLEKYEMIPEVQDYFNTLIISMRVHATVFDLGSILIKPVQRILKYPLLLVELLKTTENDHPDYEYLESSVRAMRDVAVYINEFKRRKDLVLKYKKPSDVSIRDMFSRLTVHSYKKKLGRLSMMVVGALTVDEEFSHAYEKFKSLEETISLLLRNISQYTELLQEALVNLETVANDIVEYYGNNHSDHEIDQLLRTCNRLSHTIHSNFKNCVNLEVLPPLNSLVVMLQGPRKVIRKRYHKLLDYDNALTKQRSNRDADQAKQISEEVQCSKINYEALNAQLLEDLPKFCHLSVSVMTDSLRLILQIEEEFYSSVCVDLSKLLKMKLIRESNVGIVESFNIAHVEVIDRLFDMHFIPKSFNSLADEKRKLKGQRSYESAMASTTSPPPRQSNGQRCLLSQTFSSERLFTVTEDFEGTQFMDLKISEGILVGVIKESDPTGNRDRYLVSDGVNKGFIPKRLLNPFTEYLEIVSSPSSACSTPSSLISDSFLQTKEINFDVVDDNPSTSSDEFITQVEQPIIEMQPVASIDEEPVVEQHAQHDSQTVTTEVLYRAEFSYNAEGDIEVSLSEGEIVRVIQRHDLKGNDEWWLVATVDDNRRGYVPANYLCDASLSSLRENSV